MAATLIPVGALGWLGVRVLDQDRALEVQRRRESLELTAGRLALAIGRRLGDLEEQLARGSGIRLTTAGVEPGRLYQPSVSPAEEVAASVFSAAEELEFQRQDFAGAAEAYRRLAESSRPARAAALVRLGRVLRKRGDHGGALEVYGRMQEMGPVPVAGQPAELIARQGRCRVFDEAGDTERLRKEVAELARVLYTKSWRIDRATFDLYRRHGTAVGWAASLGRRYRQNRGGHRPMACLACRGSSATRPADSAGRGERRCWRCGPGDPSAPRYRWSLRGNSKPHSVPASIPGFARYISP